MIMLREETKENQFIPNGFIPVSIYKYKFQEIFLLYNETTI